MHLNPLVQMLASLLHLYHGVGLIRAGFWSEAPYKRKGGVHRTYAEWQPILCEHDIWFKPVREFEDQRDLEHPAYQ